MAAPLNEDQWSLLVRTAWRAVGELLVVELALAGEDDPAQVAQERIREASNLAQAMNPPPADEGLSLLRGTLAGLMLGNLAGEITATQEA